MSPTVTSPAFGIGYSLWLRLRWVISGILILLLMLALTVQLFPLAAPYCCLCAIAVLFAATLFLLNTFSYGPTNLGVRSSGFPTHMKVFAVTTRALVGWPMLFAAATFAFLWALSACLIFIPAGFPIPILWPASMLAAFCLCVQAIAWTPFPSPFARVPALVITISPLLLPLSVGITFFDGATFSKLIFVSGLACSLGAYCTGVWGLSRARAGSEWDLFPRIAERWAARTRRRYAAAKHHRAFRSAVAAQLWHECRRNGMLFPVMMAFIGPLMLLILCLPVLNPRANDTFLFGSFAISPLPAGLIAWAFFPFALGLSMSGAMAKFDIWGKEAMPAFFATRPLTTNQFILIKLCATALGTLAAWAITFGLFAGWAILEVSPLNAHPSIIRAALAEATPRSIVVLIFVVVGLVTWTWREVVSGLWPTLTGRKYLANAVGFAFMIAISLLGIAGSWIYQHPDYHAIFWTVVPWIVGALIVLKLCIATWLSLALQNRRLLTPKMTRWLALGWLLLAGCLMGGLWLVASPTWTFAATIAMALPFPSLAAAPLALDWNRHR